MVRILLAEDVAMVRGALVALIEREPDLMVVADVAGGDDILPVALAKRPDVAIIDIDRPVLAGLDAAVLLRERLPSCRTLILASLFRPGTLHRVLAAEVAGYILKEAPAGQLASAIRSVAAGHQSAYPALSRLASGSRYSPLSQREHAILNLAAEGDEPAEIAAALHLSVGTVRNYLTTIVAKLHARNRIDAIRKAHEAGWL